MYTFSKKNKRARPTFERAKPIKMTKEVLRQIQATIGTRRPECGGILGSSDGVTIDYYYFDSDALTTSGTYTMNTKALNKTIHYWNDNDVRFSGIIHSHPNGVTEPSPQDVSNAEDIMDIMDMDGIVYIPIVQVSPKLDGSITIYFYSVKRTTALEAMELTIVESAEAEREKEHTRQLDELAKDRFVRIQDILPTHRMKEKQVIFIGDGTAAEQALALARSGVGRFVLIEGDTVEAANIATQGAYVSDIGSSKASVLKKRILDTDPTADVVCIERFLTDEITDEEFAVMTGILEKRPEDVLICGCTDDFYAQDRAMQLALKYGVPYIAGQVFKGASGYEVLFTYPGVTAACPRCMLDTRYEKMLSNDSAESTGRSGNAPYSLAEHMNAIKTYFSLLLLCYNEPETKYYRRLDRYAEKNYIMTRCEEDMINAPAYGPLDKLRERENDLDFPYASVAIGQCPEPDCPVCRGKGDLRALMGNITDTRITR